MAVVRNRRTRGAVTPPARVTRRRAPTQSDNRNLRYVMEYVDINSIVPYEFNPRKNEAAVESVANSIKLVGFIVPVVLDNSNVVVAGHTRIEAGKLLRLTDVPVIRAEQLTEEQLIAFRLIDNKVSELAKWDFDLLSGEISKLRDSGLPLTDYGWTREELDCLSDVISDDCLSTEGLVDLDAAERLRRAERRAPSTARFVCGELVFFIQATDYRNWVDGIRTLHDYDEQAITQDLKRRLGITETG